MEEGGLDNYFQKVKGCHTRKGYRLNYIDSNYRHIEDR